MPFYASQYAGSGAELDPFIPSAATAANVGQWQGIDLRPDCSVASGWSLVWTDVAPSPMPSGVVLIAATPDSALSNPTVNQINSSLGTNLPQGATLREAVVALMTTEATGQGNGKWNRVLAGRDGKVRIFLGDLYEEWTE